jgi:WD40 repeat protein
LAADVSFVTEEWGLALRMEVYAVAHKELVSCTNMSLNTLALLAGRRCYAIVDLANPSQPAIRESRQCKWGVVCSQWSVQDEMNLAVASNNKVELKVGEGELSAATTLSAHTRIITDFSWHTLDANLMASSSADNFIYLWDSRDPEEAQDKSAGVAGCLQD